MRNAIARVAVAVTMILAGLGFVGTQAGAQANPYNPTGKCTYPGNSWYDAFSGPYHHAINCSIIGNHVVVDAHRGADVSYGVMDFWLPAGSFVGSIGTDPAGGFTVQVGGQNGGARPGVYKGYGDTWLNYSGPNPCATKVATQGDAFGDLRMYRFGQVNITSNWVVTNVYPDAHIWLRPGGTNWGTPRGMFYAGSEGWYQAVPWCFRGFANLRYWPVN